MRPAPFEYVRPSTVAEALEALAGGGTPLAGGQSLLPQLKLRQVRPLPSLEYLLERARSESALRAGRLPKAAE